MSTSLEIGLNGLTISSVQSGSGEVPPPPPAAMNFGLTSNSQYIALLFDEL